MQRFSFLLLFVAAACGFPHPPLHGPVPAPPRVTTNPEAILAEVRSTYPQARLEPSGSADSIRLTFGPGPLVTSADAFASSFFPHYAERLGTGPLGRVFGTDRGSTSVRGAFGEPPRDSGCRRVKVVLEIAALAPTTLARTCERFTRAPPSYHARSLPSTAPANVDILVRVGSIGGIAGPLFSGLAIDRYGDVYEASDYLPGPVDAEPTPFLREYVRTLPAEEVEQFALDVSLALREREEPDTSPVIPDLGGAVVQAFVLGSTGTVETVDLAQRRGPAASRAVSWVERAARR